MPVKERDNSSTSLVVLLRGFREIIYGTIVCKVKHYLYNTDYYDYDS